VTSVRRTERTLAVLGAIHAHPGASNMEVAYHAGGVDGGQLSKLLHRLERVGAITNAQDSKPKRKGSPNSWRITQLGVHVLTNETIEAELPLPPLSDPVEYDVELRTTRRTHIRVQARSWADAKDRALVGHGIEHDTIEVIQGVYKAADDLLALDLGAP
jgi:hypothetical protein